MFSNYIYLDIKCVLLDISIVSISLYNDLKNVGGGAVTLRPANHIRACVHQRSPDVYANKKKYHRSFAEEKILYHICALNIWRNTLYIELQMEKKWKQFCKQRTNYFWFHCTNIDVNKFLIFHGSGNNVRVTKM